ncbi:glutathione S-transferase family protein [Sulfitobacter sp. S0837]|uniref:glutathione S-transferase family protein n=1 Tax=Sulfitobacter maritimus TaxID=2741719 RepID=UPI00158231CA|nr:glutathione S-transferase family protein [Sulfitobacter maritimus]NUH65405.1 glutathione S-transferase family protein [Sulfitobacter maritimus]
MLKLYYAPGTIAVAVALALEEVGLAYEPIKVDFASAAQTKPDYLVLNPKGRVPALVTDAGTVLTETGALLEYIATIAPKAKLVPSDAERAAHMRSVMYYLASTMHVAHAHKMRGHRWADQTASHEDMKAKVPQTMADCAAYIENHAFLGDYIAGDSLSLADPYLFVVSTWLAGDGVNRADFPRLEAFAQRMEARDSVKTLREKGRLT